MNNGLPDAKPLLAPNIQKFTSSGVWFKPPGAKAVRVICIGAGGGGGSGRRGAAGTDRRGGGGAQGGGVIEHTFRADDLLASEAVTVGAGGAIGAAITVNDTNGNVGFSGGSTSFGSKVLAGGGLGGVAGLNIDNTNQTSGGNFGGGTGPACNGISSVTPNATLGAAGGGPGSLISAADAGATASSGGSALSVSVDFAPGAALDGVAGTNGTNQISGAPTPGMGGGGGGFGIAGNAGAGGAGATYGGGGGGGGASLNGHSSGAGGVGGNGICVVISW